MATQNSNAAAAMVVASVADLGATLDEAITNLLASVGQGRHVIAMDGTLDTSTAGGKEFVEVLRAVQAAAGDLRLNGVSGA